MQKTVNFNNKSFVYTFFILLILYISLAIYLPIDPEVLAKYSLSPMTARLLTLTIVIPISLVYLSALFGFIRFNDYTRKISLTKEGGFFESISLGIMITAFSLPLLAIINSYTSHLDAQDSEFYTTAYATQLYIRLFLAYIGFYFIDKGARGLIGSIKNVKKKDFSELKILAPVIIASLYSWLITSDDTTTPETSAIPSLLRILTIVVPFVYVWSLGIRAVYYLYLYHISVKGYIYKRSFNFLYRGIGIIVIISIINQIFTSLSSQINRLDLTPLLGVIYLLIVLYAVGYGLLAKGANQLKKIEEV